LYPGIGDAERVQPWHGVLSAQFDDLQLTHNGIAFRSLAQPEQTIGDGKDWIVAQLVLRIFTNQESGSLPTGKKKCQALNEGLQIHVAVRFANHGAEGVHNYNGGVGFFNFFGDLLQDRAQVLFQDNLAQVDEANGAGQHGWIEECVLLLVSQHFDGGFAEDREVECGAFRASVGKHKLVCKRRFSASGGTGNDVEREFRETTTHNLVKARNSGG